MTQPARGQRKNRSLPAVLLLAAWGVVQGAVAQPSAPAKQAGPLPDLDVTYVSFAPRYPAYVVEYPDGLPQALHPETGKPLHPEEADKIQRWPRVNEIVTASARVVNHGAVETGPFAYTWLVDGKRVESGRLPGLTAGCEALSESREWKLSGRTLREAPLRPGTYADLPYSFRWPKKARRLELQVRLEKGSELTDENNSRAEQTDSWSMVVAVRRSAYNAWARLRAAGGGYGFEDWVQNHLQAMRAKFDQSASPAAPEGVRTQLRLDMIRVLDDAEDLSALDELNAVNGWDCAWTYGERRSPELDARRTDWSIIKSWGRQLGLIDLNALTVDPDRNEARDPVTHERAELGYLFPGTDPMGVPDDEPFSEHTVLALNTQAQKRRGYDGAQLYALPQYCRVRVLDNNGHPVSGAAITAFQADAGRVPDQPIAAGSTDPNGMFTLPNRPAPTVHTESGYTLHPNPFGTVRRDGSNGLLLLRVAARDHVEHQWLTVLDCNVAYWHGQTTQATFDLRTRIPATRALVPPAGLRARLLDAVDLRPILLTWDRAPGEKAAGYFIYRGAYPTFQYEKIGSVTTLRNSFLDPLDADSFPGDRVRYAVSAVDAQGNESGLSPAVTLPLYGSAP